MCSGAWMDGWPQCRGQPSTSDTAARMRALVRAWGVLLEADNCCNGFHLFSTMNANNSFIHTKRIFKTACVKCNYICHDSPAPAILMI